MPPKNSWLISLNITSRDTTDVLNVYKLNIEEGDLGTIHTTWAKDARWLNAFRRSFVGRDTIISWLKYLYSTPEYAASSLFPDEMIHELLLYEPDVAVLHEYHEREGQIINGEITPTRKINTTYILSKEKGIWVIRDKVTMDEREPSTKIKK